MGVLIIRFANHMITENVQVFWAELQRGEFISDAAVAAGTYRKQGTRWVIANGGVRPRRGRGLKGRCLSFAEREQLGLSRAAGMSLRVIAAQLGRSPSTISRELRRNSEAGGGYLASSAQAMAYHRASRPKPAKLAVNLALREKVEQDLEKKYSPEQIVGRLLVESPTTRRCGCPPRPFTSRSMCSPAARYAVTWRCVCALGGRCGARAARLASVRTGSRT